MSLAEKDLSSIFSETQDTKEYKRKTFLNETARKILADRYVVGNEEPEDIFGRVARTFGSNDQHSARLLDYLEKQWFLPATPILSNGGTDRGLAISCFLTMCSDDRAGICGHIEENLFMSTMGGGTSGDWSTVRSVGETTSRGAVTTGAIQYMHIIDSVLRAANQGQVRRGSYASYMDLSHPEIFSFIEMRSESGEIHRKNLFLHHGVNVTDKFMEAVESDSVWNLIDPHSGKVKEVIKARYLWERILEMRLETGEPYLHFIDRSNDSLHPDLKEAGLKVRNSNLCQEIMLPTDSDYSNVCCLSSLNLEKWEEWHTDSRFIGDIVEMLDNVMSNFIKTAPSQMWRAVRGAENERSIGLGVKGWHSFLQKNSIAFDSFVARSWNRKIFSHIETCVDAANQRLAEERGPAKGLKKDRFAHLTAIAPTASISLIAGVSPSVEPWNSNLFVQKTLSGALIIRNQCLDDLLKEKLGDKTEGYENAWSKIMQEEGSVLGLDCLTDHEKEVYRTAWEINQFAIIDQAADRQKFIDQGQSINLFFPTGTNRAVLNRIHRYAWKKGLKGLYYMRTSPVVNAEKLNYEQKSGCAGGACE